MSAPPRSAYRELIAAWCDLVNDRVMESGRWRELIEAWERLREEHGLDRTLWPARAMLTDGALLHNGQSSEPAYAVRRRVGSGGNGSVHLCDGREFAAPVALKVCKTWKQVPDLFREARLLARRRFPNVVRLYGVDLLSDADGETCAPALVMEYLPGGNLYGRISSRRADRRLSAAKAAQLVGRICLGLAASQCVHRDLKPENILFDAVGRPYLADYGAALPMVISERVRFRYRFNKIIGTPGYMSPEQVVNTYHLDQRSDVYALGLILFELLTGRMAFKPRSDERALAFARRTVEEPAPVELVRDAACRAIVERCLEKEPSRRFTTCEELADALDPVTRGLNLG